ncbi:544_t:CDS:1, partial [Acaulospora colombiana]
LIHISELNECYDPLVYPLLFTHSEQGWVPYQILYRDIPLASETTNICEVPNDVNNDEGEDDVEYDN